MNSNFTTELPTEVQYEQVIINTFTAGMHDDTILTILKKSLIPHAENTTSRKMFQDVQGCQGNKLAISRDSNAVPNETFLYSKRPFFFYSLSMG